MLFDAKNTPVIPPDVIHGVDAVTPSTGTDWIGGDDPSCRATGYEHVGWADQLLVDYAVRGRYEVSWVEAHVACFVSTVCS